MHLPGGSAEWPGATPLWKDNEIRGVNFAFYTPAAATRVELCLFKDASGAHETHHFDLVEKKPVLDQDGQTVKGYIWHGFAAGVHEGQLYGFRVHGPGFNPNKLLMDPEAKAATGDPIPDPRPPGENNGDIMPKAIVRNWRALPPGHTKWLGATPDKEKGGTNFAFYTSRDAEGVELCLFDKAQGARETRRIELAAREEVKGNDGQTIIGYIWHGFARDVHEGQLYGIRVHGPYNPDKGQFFNPYKVLIDPCAKAVTHAIHSWPQAYFHHDWYRKSDGRPAMNRDDNAELVPKARVVDWRELHRKAGEGVKAGALYPHADTNLLELHVKGATIRHPGISENERGTYKALASDAFVSWVKDMGYTSLELMPIEASGTDTGLSERKLKNYWGYMTVAPMAPHPEYAATNRPEVEIMEMIRTLKRARDPHDPDDKGIEVIMDIVPNHTLEGGPNGPLLNLRGMDSSLYLPHDYTGTGNTRDFGHPMNRRMFLEELEYWQGLGVSGFRIDLATVIGREHGRDFNPDSAMMQALRKAFEPNNALMQAIRKDYDHGLKDIKFYGEPWDLGPNGVQKGRLAHFPQDEVGLFGAHFSNRFAEWNGECRDALQSLLNSGNELTRGAVIGHMAGSSGLYADPQATVNAYATHDGGTLHDMTTHVFKNNHINGEGGRDGNDMPGTDWGPEASRVQRFLIAMLGLSQGVPMTCLGNDRCKKQDGNTNPYCQDNDITYIPWGDDITPEGKEMMKFQRQVNRFRKEHSSFRRATRFSGQPDAASELLFNGGAMKDVAWLNPDASEIQPGAGGPMDHAGGFGMMLSGDPGNSPPTEKHFTRIVMRQQRDTPKLVLVNPTMQDNMEFTLPSVPGVKWKVAVNTREPDKVGQEIPAGQKIALGWRSLIAFEGQRYLERGTQAKAAMAR